MLPLIQRDYTRYLERLNVPILAKIDKAKADYDAAIEGGDAYAAGAIEQRISFLRSTLHIPSNVSANLRPFLS